MSSTLPARRCRTKAGNLAKNGKRGLLGIIDENTIMCFNADLSTEPYWPGFFMNLPFLASYHAYDNCRRRSIVCL